MEKQNEYQKLVSLCESAVKNLRDSHDLTMTVFVPIERIGDNDYAFVFGWVGYYDPEYSEDGEGNCVCGKVAYQSKNSMMQEYDIDWLMPYDKETGEVNDTEISMGNPDCTPEIAWLIDQWKRIYSDAWEKLDRELEFEYYV